MPKGRPQKYKTEEERKAAKRKSRNAWYAKNPEAKRQDKANWRKNRPEVARLHVARSELRWLLKNGHARDVVDICKDWGFNLVL